MYHVYILKCADGSLYTGITTDIERRFPEHKNKKSGNYTSSRKPVKISSLILGIYSRSWVILRAMNPQLAYNLYNVW